MPWWLHGRYAWILGYLMNIQKHFEKVEGEAIPRSEGQVGW